MNDYLLIMTTLDNKQKAKELAKNLVEKKLAACVQINDIESVYSWNNKICEDKEFLLYIKAPKKNYHDISDFILKHHTYDIPQITSIKIYKGYDKYFKWIDEVTS